jgi:hypothetical protein
LFWDRVSLLIPGWPWTCNLNLPASSIWVLRLQACLTKPDILFIKELTWCGTNVFYAAV